jgi:hypothetical protein
MGTRSRLITVLLITILLSGTLVNPLGGTNFVQAANNNSNAGGNSDNSNAGGNSDNNNAGGNSDNSNAGGNSDNSNAGGNSDNNNAGGNSDNSNAGGNSDNSNAGGNSDNSNAGGNSDNSNAGGNSDNSEKKSKSKSSSKTPVSIPHKYTNRNNDDSTKGSSSDDLSPKKNSFDDDSTSKIPTKPKTYDDVIKESKNKIPENSLFNLDNSQTYETSINGPIIVEVNELNQDISQVTLSAWINPDYEKSVSDMYVISKRDSLGLYVTNNDIHHVVLSIFNGLNWITLESLNSVPENEWSHIAVVINNDKIFLYLNGRLEVSTDISSEYVIFQNFKILNGDRINIDDSDVIIGGAQSDYDDDNIANIFWGDLGDVVIYNYAFTSEEVAKTYSDTIFENFSSLGINDVLSHDLIEINQPVTWTRDVIFESEVHNSALDLPSDAILVSIYIKNTDGKITTLFDANTGVSKNIQILDDDTSSKVLSQLKKVDNFVVITIDGEDIIHSSMDLNSEFLDEDTLRKIVLINHDSKEIIITFTTGIPVISEESTSDDVYFSKKVKVSHTSDLHYTNVLTCSDIPEALSENGSEFSLFWVVNDELIDVTDEPTFAVHLVDSDINGINDELCWNVPKLSEQNFVIQADLTIINIQSYPIVGGIWDVRFTTSGSGDLIVMGIDGTTFGDAFPDDLKFLELFNGTHSLTPVIQDNSIIYPNYSSDMEAKFSSKVLTLGKHHLEFTFGTDKEYANNSASTNIVDTSSMTISNNCKNPTTLATLSTDFEEGTNIVIASTEFTRTTAKPSTVTTWLADENGDLIGEQSMPLQLDRNNHQNGYVLVNQHDGKLNQTYKVLACGTTTNILGEVKITAFSGMKRTTFDDGDVAVVSGTDSLAFVQTDFPKGDNVIFVSLQVDNGNTAQTIPPGAIKILNRFGDVVATNQYRLNLGSSAPTDIQSLFLVTTDKNAPPDSTYTVTFESSKLLKAEAKLLVIQPANVFFEDGSRVAVPDTGISLASISTNYSDLDDVVVIASGQFDDEDNGIETISPGNYKLTQNDASLSFNEFELSSQGGASTGSNFAYVLIYRTENVISNPSYSVDATLSRSGGVVGESKLVSFITKDAGSPPGPTIESIEAGGTGLGFTDGDTIAVTFTGATNRPTVAEKINIDSLFTFLQNNSEISLGKNYVGSWVSPTTLLITFTDTEGHGSPSIGSLQIEINSSEENPSLLKSEDSLSLSSVGISPLLKGDFGTPPGPSITSITASDIAPIESGFSNADKITVRFSEDTNTPDPTPGDNKLTKSDLNNMFDFVQGQGSGDLLLGANYEGIWEKPRTLVITVIDHTGGDPVIGGFKIKSDPLTNNPILNSAANSKPSDSISPVLDGTWGQGIGPAIVSFVVEDPDGGDAVYGNGDVFKITFAEATNKPNGNTSQLFSFTNLEGIPILLGYGVTSEWIDGLTYRITINDSTGNNIPTQVGQIKVQALPSGNILNVQGNSIPSDSISPPLIGNFGQKEGPSIVSVTASGEIPGITSDDKLTIKFSQATNRPLASNSQEINKLVKITNLAGTQLILGSDFTGKWVSSSILEIIVTNPSGNNCSTVVDSTCAVDGKIKISILEAGGLKNEQNTSLASKSVSSPITGSFGIKEGPSIISLKANDPGDIVPGFSVGDIIKIRFSEPTTVPLGTGILTKSQVDSLFLFSQSLSDGYTGIWSNSQTFDITITDATIDSPPKIGELRVTAKSLGNIQSATGSAPSKATSPPLDGTFGDKSGPSIVSVTAFDPRGDDINLDKDDTLTIKFSESTNQVDPTPMDGILTKSDVDSIFTFTKILGANYNGKWIDATRLQITILDAAGNTLPIVDGKVDSSFRISVNSSAGLKDTANISLPSISQSPPTIGTFGSKQGPQIVSLSISDPNNNPGYGAGDVITILFSESTSAPTVSTKSAIDSLMIFKTNAGGSTINLGTTLSGTWINPYTLKISIVQSDGTTMPSESSAIGAVVAEIRSTANLRDATGTSLASNTISPPLKGTFGIKSGPSIKSLVADDPDSLDSVYSVGDVLNIRFSELTNKKDPTPGDEVLTRTDIDSLFSFTQAIGDDYDGRWIDGINLQITIREVTLESPPEIGELKVVARSSGGIQAFGGSANSISTSPALSGSFGTFEENITLADGGTATTTLPSGITTSLTLDASSSGTFDVESAELDASSEESATFGILGDTVEITPNGESPCTVDNPCVIEFIFDIVDVQSIDPEMSPFDVRVLHDLDDNGIIENPNQNGENEVLETTIVQLDESTYRASASVEHFSKFAVGGVKALALGALAGSINNSALSGSSNMVSSPQIGKMTISSMSDSSNDLGRIIAQINPGKAGEKIILPTNEQLVFNVELFEDSGIANVRYVEFVMDFGGLEPTSDVLTSITLDEHKSLLVSDPKQLLADSVITILEEDPHNGVLQLKLTFEKPMDTSSIRIVTWDLEKNVSYTTFENILRIEPKTHTTQEIPKWIKSSASWWSNDQISDKDFIQGIEFLVKENIIPVDSITTSDSSSEISPWVKNNAKWWSEDLITDDEFVTGIEHLIKIGIIHVNSN